MVRPRASDADKASHSPAFSYRSNDDTNSSPLGSPKINLTSRVAFISVENKVQIAKTVLDPELAEDTHLADLIRSDTDYRTPLTNTDYSAVGHRNQVADFQIYNPLSLKPSVPSFLRNSTTIDMDYEV